MKVDEYTFEDGDFAFESGQFDKALKIFEYLANKGDVKAQISLACMYHAGDGVERDLEKAMKWYTIPAEKGYEIAINNIACLLFEKNDPSAIFWLLSAAEKDIPTAQSILGDLYSGNMNLPGNEIIKSKDLNEAIKWYLKAGDNGFPYAYYQLAQIYSDKNSNFYDDQKSNLFYSKAHEAGYILPHLINNSCNNTEMI